MSASIGTMTSATAPASRASTLGRFTRLLGRFIEILMLWQERAEARHRLSEMDDYLLKDIGLSRADVQRETEKRFWQG